MPHDVFLSYSSRDKTVADAACATLEARGMRCWIAPRDVLAGTSWGGAIVEAIAASRAMVLIFSGEANTSEQIKREVERAVHRGIPIIPFRIEAITPSADLEYFISVPHWLDALSPPLEHHLDSLAATVEQLLATRPVEADSAIGARPGSKTPFGGALAENRSTAVRRGNRRWWLSGAGLALALCGVPVAWFLGWRGRASPNSKSSGPNDVSTVKEPEDARSTNAELPAAPVVPASRQSSAVEVVNLLDLIDVEQHPVRGLWRKVDKSLFVRGPSLERGQEKVRGFELAIPWNPPEEYLLRIVLNRARGETGAFSLGLSSGSNRFLFLIDVPHEGKVYSGPMTGPPRKLAQDRNAWRGPILGSTPCELTFTIRRDGFEAAANGRRIHRSQGRLDRLSRRPGGNMAPLLLAGTGTYSIDRLELESLGQGVGTPRTWPKPDQ